MNGIKEDSVYKAGGVTVKVKKIPFGTRWTKPCADGNFKVGDLYKADRLMSGGTGKIKGITIHNRGDSANAATYALATFNQNMNSARVHFYVDSNEAWQLLELNEVGWHAGTGNYGKGNDDTIAVEIIMGARAKHAENDSNSLAYKNGAMLVAYLLKITGLTVADVYTHKDWSGKSCPYYILPELSDFKSLVSKYLDELYEYEELGKSETAKKDNPFDESDSVPDDYAREAVDLAVKGGILKGYGNGRLGLRDYVTRQDLAVILHRLGLLSEI